MSNLPVYHNDNTLKFEYAPVIHKQAFPRNAVGPHAGLTIPEVDYTDTDANTIYVKGSTGSDGNVGTAASPVATINYGISLCTLLKTKVVILDSNTYEGELVISNTYFQGLYHETGFTPLVSLRTLGFTPSDANTIFVAKSGNDSTGTGTQADPVLTITKAITLCTVSKQGVGIMDSETYVEKAFAFAGNFLMLFAMIGCTPTVDITKDDSHWTMPIDVTETIFHNPSTDGMDVARLRSGSIIIVYTDAADSYKGKYIILDSNFNIIVSETQFYGSAIGSVKVKQLSSGNIIIVYNTGGGDGYKGRYTVLNDSYTVLVAAGIFHANTTYWTAVTETSSGKIFIAYSDAADSYKGKYVVLNVDYTEFVSETIFKNTSNVFGVDCDGSDDNGVVVITYLVGTQAYYIGLEDTAFSVVKSETNFAGCFTPAFLAVAHIPEIGFVLSFCWDYASGYPAQYMVVDYSYNTLIAATALKSTKTAGIGVDISEDGKIVFVYIDTNDSNKGKYQVFNPTNYHITVSASSTMNGISFTSSDRNYLAEFIKSTANMVLKWCTFDGIASETLNQTCWAIYSDSDINAYNCILRDGDRGFYTEENESIIQENHFYRNNRGYCIHIKGAAASLGDISIEHNDLFNNYAGIRLETNNGANERVRNNILYKNSNGNVVADTDITISNSVSVGALTHALVGAGVIHSNPLYINEGGLDPDDTDLNIKTRVAGYQVDSPAKGLASDLTNAGALDVAYVGTETSWSTITVQKPKDIEISLDTVGKGKNISSDGTVFTKKTGQVQKIEITWDGIINADLESILLMWGQNTPSVRAYLNPTTSPNDYLLCQIDWASMKISPKYYKLSRTGTQGVVLTLLRAWELS